MTLLFTKSCALTLTTLSCMPLMMCSYTTPPRTLWQNSRCPEYSMEIKTVQGRATYHMHIPPTVSPRTSCQLIHALPHFNEDGNQTSSLCGSYIRIQRDSRKDTRTCIYYIQGLFKSVGHATVLVYPINRHCRVTRGQE